MKREIKFRAWVKTIENMYSWKRLVNQRGWWEDKEYILMQFTGLLDRHQKPIYEGDIVRFGKIKSEIIFEEGAFKIKTAADWNTQRGVFCYQEIPKEVEIIGNIYSNPELFKEEK